MMKYIKTFLTIIIILSALACWADFDDTGISARAMGMGGSFVALADDVYALYYNPAGLGWLKRSEFAAEYERLYWGLSDESTIAGGFLGFTQPLKFYSHLTNRVEKSSGTFETETTEKVQDFGVLGLGLVNFGLVNVYQEYMVLMGWGKRFGDRFSWGITLKGLMEKYTQDGYTRIDPVFDMGATSTLNAYSFDTGILYNFAPRIFAGLMLMDLNQPDLGFKSTDKLPMSIKTGICYREKTLRVLLDTVCKENDVRINCGAEKWLFKNAFGLRAGTSLGTRNLRDLTLGVSWDLKAFRIDYGFLFPVTGIEETAGTHRVSLVCRFGRIPDDELEPGSIEAELNQLEKEQRELKAQLHDAIEMKEKIEQVLIEEALARVKERIKSVKYVPSSRKESFMPDIENTITHVVGKGETLKSISQKYFDTQKKWLDIYNLNKDKLGRGGSLKPGTVLLIPSMSQETAVTMIKQPVIKTKQEPKKIIKQEPTPPAESSKDVKNIVPPSKQEIPSPKPLIKTNDSLVKRTHTVATGETLQTIAVKYYGSSSRWKDIYNANKGKVKMGRVEPGTELVIP